MHLYTVFFNYSLNAESGSSLIPISEEILFSQTQFKKYNIFENKQTEPHHLTWTVRIMVQSCRKVFLLVEKYPKSVNVGMCTAWYQSQY